MAFGPDDIGHWKDKLPYVRHDLELIKEREATLSTKFGRFDFGFDFGAPVNHAGDLARYRSIPYSLRNSVEPRFEPVDPKSENWVTRDRGRRWDSAGAVSGSAGGGARSETFAARA